MIQKYTEQFKRPELFASINGQIVSVPVEPENPLHTAEMTLEDDYGMIDGVINMAAVVRNWRKPRPRRAGPRRRRKPSIRSGWRTQTGVWDAKSPGPSLPRRRSPRRWADL